MKKTTKRGARKPFDNPKAAMRKVRRWLVGVHPEEKPMLGEFRADVTFAEINERMHASEDFYEICNCTESEQREIVFAELARIYGTSYDYWYDLWLAGGKARRQRGY